MMVDLDALRTAADAEAEKGPTCAVSRRLLQAIVAELTVGRAAIAACSVLETAKAPAA